MHGTNPVCPFCGKKQIKQPIKTWAYGKTEVNRYECQCKKTFNHYKSEKSSWTIPSKNI